MEFNEGVPGDWKVPRYDSDWLAERVHKMVKTVTEDIGQAEQAIQGLWNTLTEDEEPDEF